MLLFGSVATEKGWRNLVAVMPNQMADAWEYLSRSPMTVTPLCYPLKFELEIVTREGVDHRRWQLKLNSREGARIWYYVIGNTVYLEQVHTSHPNQTK